MAERNVNVNLNVSWVFLLGVVFVLAKLAGWVNWSWWLVLAPFYVPVALALTVAAVATLVLVVSAMLAP